MRLNRRHGRGEHSLEDVDEEVPVTRPLRSRSVPKMRPNTEHLELAPQHAPRKRGMTTETHSMRRTYNLDEYEEEEEEVRF